jgi:DASH complex subunit DAD2
MSYSARPLPSHLRQGSTAGNSVSTGQSPILLARINEKKAELENLKQLRDLSAGLAGQMQMLEEKLATLSDGTEGRPMHKELLGIITDQESYQRLLQY